MTNALACGECGAGLPPPNAHGASFCVYCGTEHRERSSEVLAAAAQLRDSSPDMSGVIPSLALINEAHANGAPASAANVEEAARIPMTEAAVLDLVRRHFEGFESVFVCPHIPPKKEMAARRAHIDQLPARERVIALYDASWLGTGDEGFLITSKRVCWKNSGERGKTLLWQEVDPDALYLDLGCLWIGDHRIIVTDDAALDASANAFHILALSASARPPSVIASGPIPRDTHPDPVEAASGGGGGRSMTVGRSATPPPPHTTSYHAYATHAEQHEPDYSCWHCLTPLWKNTPQCAYCGAFPKPRKGWLRTG